jgi:hypothetical protein
VQIAIVEGRLQAAVQPDSAADAECASPVPVQRLKGTGNAAVVERIDECVILEPAARPDIEVVAFQE